MLGEALQTALRAAGVPNGYELLKDFTRGADVDAAGLAAFIDKLPLPPADRAAAEGAHAGRIHRPGGADGALDLRRAFPSLTGFP